jgi:hypothetical protein
MPSVQSAVVLPSPAPSPPTAPFATPIIDKAVKTPKPTRPRARNATTSGKAVIDADSESRMLLQLVHTIGFLEDITTPFNTALEGETIITRKHMVYAAQLYMLNHLRMDDADLMRAVGSSITEESYKPLRSELIKSLIGKKRNDVLCFNK